MRHSTLHHANRNYTNRIILPFLLALLFGAGLMGTTIAAPAEQGAVSTGEPQVSVVVDGLLGPIGLTALPDGSILVAEEGTGSKDQSAGVTLIKPDGTNDRFISGLVSTRDAGDLAGVPLVGLSPDGTTLYVGNFGQGHLWTYALSSAEQANGLDLPAVPYTPEELGTAMAPLNRVALINPFDIAFDDDGIPVVSDASGNGVAKQNPDGTTRFIHRFESLPNLETPSDPIEAVPTGIVRVPDAASIDFAGSTDQEVRYYVTLTGGCPYPPESGMLVMIDEARNQETVASGLNMPIDVAVGADGTTWVLEFARFTPGASCFTGEGYQSETGRLSRLHADGTLETVLDNLDFPGAVLPMPDGSLYISEVLPGRILHVTFPGEAVGEDIEEGVAATGRTPGNAAPADTNDNALTGTVLRDVTEDVGLHFQQGAFHTAITPDPVAAMGAGLCWIDYDNDGRLDLYLINSHAEAEVDSWMAGGGLPHNQLYHNESGTFQDVSATTGTDLALRGNGCVAADFNNDGWTDIYITADGPNALLWNQGDGTFVEGAAAAGVDAAEWNASAAVADLNGDGWLDLFVTGYIDLDNKISNPVGAFPQDYYGIPDRLYLNLGPEPVGRAQGEATSPEPVVFREVTEDAWLTREERGLGALLTDLDNDGDLDLYIANDGHPNRLYANYPVAGGIATDPAGLGFRFVDLTETADVGDSGSGMGIAGGDFDGDSALDLLITNWERELNALYRNEIDEERFLTFQYSTFRIGISGLGNNKTGWGVHLVDLDQDTDVDMLITHGRVPVTDLTTDPELVRFYRNRSWNQDGEPGRAGQFVEGTEQVGLMEVGPLLGRGSALADYDNDGDLDVAINTIAGEAVLLRNEGTSGNWLTLDLGGIYPGTRAMVTLPDGRRLVREAYVGSSYLASEDPRLHFGLGTFENVPLVEVRFPDGETRTLGDVAANQTIVVGQRPGQ